MWIHAHVDSRTRAKHSREEHGGRSATPGFILGQTPLKWEGEAKINWCPLSALLRPHHHLYLESDEFHQLFTQALLIAQGTWGILRGYSLLMGEENF